MIFITGHGTADTAIEAMRLGAYEYLLKPLELDHLTDLVDRAFEISRLMRVPATIPEGGEAEDTADAMTIKTRIAKIHTISLACKSR